MDHDPMLTIILLLVALALVMQAGAMVGFWLSSRKMNRQLDSIREDIKLRVDPIAQSVSEILASSREPVRAITANLAEVSRVLRDRTRQVDGVMEDLVDKSRLQIIRADQMVSDLVQKVEATVEAVQRQVMGPIQEIAALFKGLRTGLEFLFSRRRAPATSEATQDEQMFI